MLKNIVIGILMISVLGAAGAALTYQAISNEDDSVDTANEPLVNKPDNSIDQQQGEPVIAAEGYQSQAWQETGIIADVDDYGFQFTMQNGETIYIELGPPDYWQNQGVALQVGQTATVNGMKNEDMIHATQVVLADGPTIQVRTETGQPLWSGSVENGQGQNGEQSDGDHDPEPQAQVDEWISITGTLMSFQGGNMTMATAEGDLLSFQTGQPRFFADQGVTFQVGDAISVVGYYENEQFVAGDITQIDTGLRVMLRDPNGRPLWAGPGNSNGNGNGNGQRNGGGND